jgi:protein farnesyltransferase/geranylgeranyltransferase type-1 subunit alpha
VFVITNNNIQSTEEHIPYNEREEWQDITPIPQDDGPDPVCPIAYSDDCRLLRIEK